MFGVGQQFDAAFIFRFRIDCAEITCVCELDAIRRFIKREGAAIAFDAAAELLAAGLADGNGIARLAFAAQPEIQTVDVAFRRIHAGLEAILQPQARDLLLRVFLQVCGIVGAIITALDPGIGRAREQHGCEQEQRCLGEHGVSFHVYSLQSRQDAGLANTPTAWEPRMAYVKEQSMWFLRLTASLCLCLLLAGCVLQSDAPLFSEEQGALLLKPYGERLSAESYDKGVWKADEGILTLKVNGQHYIASNDKDDKIAEVLFADVGNGLFAMQFKENDKRYSYALLEAKPEGLLVRPLSCGDLEKLAGTAEHIAFKGSDCFVKAKPDADTFKAWAEGLGPATMRLKPAP